MAKRRVGEPFYVGVEYKGGVDYPLDREIKRAARPGSYEAGGYLFHEELRDLVFGYKTRAEAVRTAKKLKKMFGRKVKTYAQGRIWP